MTGLDPFAIAEQPAVPPEVRLHDRLARLLRDAERHHSPALRALAELRRGDGRFGGAGQASATLLRLVGPLAPEGSTPLADEATLRWLDDAMLVAWLVATTRPTVGQGHGGRGSFGSDFKGVRRDHEATSEHLMDLLLASSREDVSRPLRRALALLSKTTTKNGNPLWLDVAALIRDLGAWDDESRPVQRRWALDFWTFVPGRRPHRPSLNCLPSSPTNRR